MDYAFYNGSVMPYDEAKIPLYDRSVFFGDGVYDCMLGRCGRVFQFTEHMDRLRKNAGLISLSLPYSDGEILDCVNRLIRLSGCTEYTVYVQLSRTAERRCHTSPDFKKSSLLITVCETSLPRSYERVSLFSFDDIRYRMCNVKTLNLLPNVLVAERAMEEGADEGVFVRDGIITECSRSNIFAIKSGRIITHPESRSILPGITRKNVLRIAKAVGLQCEERCFTYDELLSSDGAFITSTTRLVRGVGSVDGNPISQAYEHVIKTLYSLILEEYVDFCC